jgi:hypothetical protein
LRWSIIAAGLAPFALAEIRTGRMVLARNIWLILAAGFLGMFLCGGPVYIAGITTTAIHIALIMALSPIVVLLISAILGMERIGPLQLGGMALALAGALLIISGGHLETLTQSSAASGDLLVVLAMLGWSGYTVLQSRVAPGASLLARVSVFAAVGALCSLPLALREMWLEPVQAFNQKAAAAYVFAGLVPGLIAYAGFAWLGGKFGSVQDLARALSWPARQRAVVVPDPRRAAEANPLSWRTAHPRRRLGQLAEVVFLRRARIPLRVDFREFQVPLQASRIGHRILVDDLLDGVAEQEPLDRQLLLFAGQRARDFGHGKNLVRQKAAGQAGFDRLVDLHLHRAVEGDAFAQHHEQRHVAFAAEIFEIDHHRVEHLRQRFDR